jgi:hypothetical protein
VPLLGTTLVGAYSRLVTARMLLVISFVFAGLMLSARPAVACTCQAYTPTELAEVSEVVFTGVARAYFDVHRTTDSADVEFQVRTVYKGPVASRIRVQALSARGWSGLGAGCGWGLHLGVQYTVFAIDYDQDGVPNTNGCLWPVEGPIEPATYGLAAGQAPPRSDEALPLLIVAALAIVALTVISIARRPRHTV